MEPLIQALKDRDSRVRILAVEALENLRAVEVLIQILEYQDEMVRERSFEALINLKKIEPLVKALKNQNSSIQMNVAKVLEKIQWAPKNAEEKAYFLIAEHKWNLIPSLGKDAIDPLIKALNNQISEIRGSAAIALGNVRDPRAVEPLIQTLQDRDSDVRWKVSEALGKIKDSRAVEPLIEALKDKNEYVRKNAAEALDKMQWTPESDEKKAWFLIAKQKWEDLEKLGKVLGIKFISLSH